ncbi:hypothetical protein [Xanthomonas sp. 3058]|uniref:hypothetical protein n=1 Tax=Xanthomonas sp. 3058 TaxID=3035314 RepID=UPI0016190706|nr:hypothetical protein [Xanthomonas sp. 3058]MBB5866328.1 hypothetical protein [Xanthomonas sp. 3058]
MKRIRLATTAALCICVPLCNAAKRPQSADIYFRPFEATSIMRLTEQLMVTSADSTFHITDNARLARVRSLVDLPCQPSTHQSDDMDLRVLIYFNGKDGRTPWKASSIDDYDGFNGKMCSMPPTLATALSKEFTGT